ncbi:MAG: GNAT family N-acetyltransferase [Smithellaceae bacterium]|nr:GNAT family N-acetyltransferase [Smithellaceae bacterium]
MIEYKTGTSCIDWNMLTELYGEVGLVANHGKKKESNIIREAFQASHKVVTAWSKDKLIGAGRMLTDGICYGSIFDVGVLPSFQKQGIGKGIITEILKGNEHLCIHLTSTFGNEQFYKHLGFSHHKTAMAKYPYASEYLE